MPFDPARYGASVVAVLSLDGDGERLMPLARGTCSSGEAARRLREGACNADLASGIAPEAAVAGLWLYFSCLDESHETSQAIQSKEGAFWHAILHRQEPDAWNAKYWFRQVGRHPIDEPLGKAAREIAARHESDLTVPARWDAAWFVDLCDSLSPEPEYRHHRVALEIQRAEWQLLFDYCASPAR
ncbi:MAG: hypothetical protein IT169_11400 [Bryobacterales bacterium]|nr:hypothetical protein [Bryobacterales bacterium]